MVKVAGRESTGAVDWAVKGIFLPLLPVAAAWLDPNLAWAGTRRVDGFAMVRMAPGATAEPVAHRARVRPETGAAFLRPCLAMLAKAPAIMFGVGRGCKVKIKVRFPVKTLYEHKDLHRWSVGFQLSALQS